MPTGVTRFRPVGPLFVAVLSLALPADGLSETEARSELRTWDEEMSLITPRAYDVKRAPSAPVIDGDLSDAAWEHVPWTDDFVDISTPERPRYATRAKLCWDDHALYIAAQLEEPHLWATLKQHDSVIFNDPDFEVFIDPDGDTHRYSELELNALNTTWDLLLDKPYQDLGNPDNLWELKGLRTAVRLHGTLNDPSNVDEGWTVEMEIPWTAFDPIKAIKGPPAIASVWHLNFSRVEWQVTYSKEGYQKRPGVPEYNWVWSPQGVIDMHRPEMWGLVRFVSETLPALPASLPGNSARKQALRVYYAQRDFQKHTGRWAASLEELQRDANIAFGSDSILELLAAPAGYRLLVSAPGEQGTIHRWTINQERLLTMETLPLP